MKTLYPPLEPYNTGYLEVSQIHSLYYEESGTPSGIPVVFLHGGPGSGTKPLQRQLFNPEKYRIILFDQRGSGKSKPLGELKENTTAELVEDIEKLRKELQIESWVVFGRSWGSCLGLVYAEKYPDIVKHLIIGGVFTCTAEEVKWLFDEKGAAQFYPQEWQKLLNELEVSGTKNVLELIYSNLFSRDSQTVKRTTKAFNEWENVTAQLEPVYAEVTVDDHAVARAQILVHYCVNQGFMPEKEIQSNLKTIKDLPVTIVQGRYDMVCPLKTAWHVHKRLSNSTFHPVIAGHAMSEPEISSKIIEKTDSLATHTSSAA